MLVDYVLLRLARVHSYSFIAVFFCRVFFMVSVGTSILPAYQLCPVDRLGDVCIVYLVYTWYIVPGLPAPILRTVRFAHEVAGGKT